VELDDRIGHELLTSMKVKMIPEPEPDPEARSTEEAPEKNPPKKKAVPATIPKAQLAPKKKPTPAKS
jgi:hypothetical protein